MSAHNMFCRQCGKNILDDSPFCPTCGEPQTAAQGITTADSSNDNANQSVAIEADSSQGVAAHAVTPKRPRLSTLQKAKRMAWRISAGYLWARFVIDNIASGTPLHAAEAFTVHKWTNYLSQIGFAPGNPNLMLPVLKYGWLLTITGLDPAQLLGFAIYVFSFPITMFVLFLVGGELNVPQQISHQQGLSKAHPRKVFLPIAIGANAAWFLLYGNTSSPKQVMVGIFCSGLLFVVLAFRAIERARPLADSDIAFASGLERFVGSAASDQTRLKVETKFSASLHLRFEKFYKYLAWLFACTFRGRRGRERVTMYILVEYVGFFLLLAFSAVLFWGLAIRLSVSPPLPFARSFLLSASHFLPGMVLSDVPVNAPLWTQVGPALTAWILFVVFVGPAASLLPARQAIYAAQVEARCRSFRKFNVQIGERIRLISRLRDRCSK